MIALSFGALRDPHQLAASKLASYDMRVTSSAVLVPLIDLPIEQGGYFLLAGRLTQFV